MKEPIWLEDKIVIDIHDLLLAEFGGLEGIRDQGLFESALQAPQQAWFYEDPKPDLCALAAKYATRIAKNHAFNDGNKRTSVVVAETFLAINGVKLTASDEDFFKVILEVAVGSMSEKKFGEWLRKNVVE